MVHTPKLTVVASDEH
jgi:hypothetical protein